MSQDKVTQQASQICQEYLQVNLSMKLWMSSILFNISGSVEEGSATSSGNSTN